MKKLPLFIFIFLALLQAFSRNASGNDYKIYDLSLSQDDIVVLPEDGGHFVKGGNGAHLFIKKRGDIQSVALLIKNKNYNDPDLSLMRAKETNSVNGNELLYSDGSKSTFRMERLPNALISSTAEKTAFGECFHIYVPKKMYYGYLIQVQDECEFEDGMTVSIRAFSEKYCDVAGKVHDNFLQLNLSDWQIEEAFAKIAVNSDGKVVHVVKVNDLTQKLLDEVDSFIASDQIDLVFAMDATDSMKDDFAELKKNWLSKFEKQLKSFSDIRIGLLLYKDYGDEFNANGLPVKNLGFLKDAKAFSKAVKNVSIRGGGDKEEAVYEALYSCAADFEWRSEAKKKIILIGDAPPHSESKAINDSVDGAAAVFKMLSEKTVSVDCFLISASDVKKKLKKNDDKSKVVNEVLNSESKIDEK